MRTTNLFYSISFLILFSSCNEKKEKNDAEETSFQLEVKIKNIPDSTKVVLFNRDSNKDLDSSFTSGQKIQFKGQVKEPSLSYLWLFDKDGNRLPSYKPFYLENNKMKIDGDYSDLLKAKVEGSKQSDLLSKYFDIYLNEKNELDQKLSNAENKADSIKIKNKFRQDLYKKEVEFIYSNANNQMAITQILFKKSDISKDSLRLFFKKLDSKQATSVKGQRLKDYTNSTKLKIGDQFRNISGVNLSGKKYELNDFKGKVVLLDFWHSGCLPCRRQNKNEFPYLLEKFDKNKFVIVSYSLNKKEIDWQKASKTDNISWINITDLKGEYGENIKKYPVEALPKSFLIDQNGIIVNTFTGFSGDNKIEKEIYALLN